jgi:hypothetical protein
MCVSVRGWSSTPVPPGTVLLLPYVQTSQTSFFGDNLLQISVVAAKALLSLLDTLFYLGFGSLLFTIE